MIKHRAQKTIGNVTVFVEDCLPIKGINTKIAIFKDYPIQALYTRDIVDSPFRGRVVCRAATTNKSYVEFMGTVALRFADIQEFNPKHKLEATACLYEIINDYVNESKLIDEGGNVIRLVPNKISLLQSIILKLRYLN